MQDEVNTKVIALVIKGGRISAEVLEKALKKFVEEIEKAQKQASRPKTYRGKQSIKHLVEQNAAISNIEVTDGNIKSFEHTARKYGIDYALKKDTSEQPPRYLVFFKGRDVDVMTQAFKEFSARTIKQKEKFLPQRRLFLLLPYVFAFYFVDKVAAVFRLAPGSAFVEKLTGGFANFGTAFANPLPSFHPMDLLVGVAAGLLLKLAVYIKGKNRKKFRQ